MSTPPRFLISPKVPPPVSANVPEAIQRLVIDGQSRPRAFRLRTCHPTHLFPPDCLAARLHVATLAYLVLRDLRAEGTADVSVSLEADPTGEPFLTAGPRLHPALSQASIQPIELLHELIPSCNQFIKSRLGLFAGKPFVLNLFHQLLTILPILSDQCIDEIGAGFGA
ncbi:hypothetical protein K488DRAFT_91812 [Vararia minispora EC-137]|uniref:Uncharacterized protein n=1 Tax=Vararia minispora EC-137 TaxID=1314806 RepID=A0ACB8Q5E4_9AGAM|nr:hypothetical protein K488DRAFT_91812 [Vararia minispora EC-137]